MSRKWLAVLATAVVLAGGCGEPAGPAEFDAAAIEADLLALVSRDRNLDNVSAGHGLDGAARVMGQLPSGGIILSRGALLHSVREVPDSLRGRTLEWDTETGGYLVSTRIGAPANGTRFLLYEVNAAGGSLVIPLVEAGSLEFRDQQSAPWLQYAMHLLHSGLSIIFGHVMQDKRARDGVEAAVRKRKPLGKSDLKGDRKFLLAGL